MERVKIIHAISDIIENRCKGCKLIENSQANTDGAKRKKVCDACEYGQELKTLGDQLNGKRKGKTKMTNQSRKPGRPKKETVVAPRMNKEAKKPFDELEKLACELKSNNQRMKKLEDELAEKDKLIKLKTEDQAQLMKENGDLIKARDFYKEANVVKKEEIKDIENKLKKEKENHKDVCEMLKARHIHEEAELENKYKGDLSAYKEKLEKSEQSYVELMNRNSEVVADSKRLEAKVEELTRESLFAKEDETAELRHKIECLEKTLICYIGRG